MNPNEPQEKAQTAENGSEKPSDNEALRARAIEAVTKARKAIEESGADSESKKEWLDELENAGARLASSKKISEPYIAKLEFFARMARERREKNETLDINQVVRLSLVELAERELQKENVGSVRRSVEAINGYETKILASAKSALQNPALREDQKRMLLAFPQKFSDQCQNPIREELLFAYKSIKNLRHAETFLLEMKQIMKATLESLEEMQTAKTPESPAKMPEEKTPVPDKEKAVVHPTTPVEEAKPVESPQKPPENPQPEAAREAVQLEPEAVFQQLLSDSVAIRAIMTAIVPGSRFGDLPANMPAFTKEEELAFRKHAEYTSAFRKYLEEMVSDHRSIVSKTKDLSHALKADEILANVTEAGRDFTGPYSDQKYYPYYEKINRSRLESVLDWKMRLGLLSDAMTTKMPQEVTKVMDGFISAAMKQADAVSTLMLKNLSDAALEQTIESVAVHEHRLDNLWMNAPTEKAARILPVQRRMRKLAQILLKEQVERSDVRRKEGDIKKPTTEEGKIAMLQEGEKAFEKARTIFDNIRSIEKNADPLIIQNLIKEFFSLTDEAQQKSLASSLSTRQSTDLYLNAYDLEKAFNGNLYIQNLKDLQPEKFREIQRKKLLEEQTYIQSNTPMKDYRTEAKKKIEGNMRALIAAKGHTKENLTAFTDDIWELKTRYDSVAMTNERHSSPLGILVMSEMNDAKHELAFMEKDPSGHQEMLRLATSASQEIVRNLTDKQYRIGWKLDVSSYSKNIIITIGHPSIPEDRKFYIGFDLQKKPLQFRRRSHHSRVELPDQIATDPSIRTYIWTEMNSAPLNLTANALQVSIPPDQVKIHTLTTGVTNMDYFQNLAVGTWKDRYANANNIMNRINGQQNLSEKTSLIPFDDRAQNKLEMLLTVAELPYADRIIAAIGDGSMNVGYPTADSSKERFFVDLQKDHGIMIRVNQRVQQRHALRNFATWDEMRDFIRVSWKEERQQQWNSFRNSEEIVNGKPKVIDYLRITTNEFKEDQTQLDQQAFIMNQYLHPPKEIPQGKGHQILANNHPTVQSFMNAIQAKLLELKESGVHVVVEFSAHGSASSHTNAGSMFWNINNAHESGSQQIRSSTLLSLIDQTGVSVSKYICTCHGGSHLKKFKQENSYVPKNTATYTDNKVTRGDLSYQLAYSGAYTQNANGLYAADINEDGMITQAEIREFLNVADESENAIIFDQQGNQIGALLKDDSEQWA